jgi:PAS domain S-box-containing protein
MTDTKNQIIPPVAAVFKLDREWKIVAVNRQAEKIAGIKASELIGQDGKRIFCEGKHNTYFEKICRPVSRGHVFTNYPVIFHNKNNGTSISLMASIIPVPDKDNEIGGAVICLQHITDSSYIHHLALESVADGVFTVDEEWNITSFNRAAGEITGWKKENVIGRQCSEIFHSSCCGKACLLKEGVKQGIPISNRSLFIKDINGNSIPVSVSVAPLYGPEDKVIGGVEIFRDMSDSIKNDIILSSVADGVFSINNDWKITSFNRAAEEITGWKKEEVLGKQCSEVFHSSMCGEKCLLKKSMDEKCPQIDKPIFIKSKAGASIPVSISSSPIFDNTGKVIGGIETFRDNTTAMRKKLILDSVADGVFTVDRNWKITSFNRAAEEITGWSREDALGKSCSDIFHSSICGQNCAIAESLYSGKQVSNRSIRIKTRDGRQLPVSISAAPLTDHEGNIIGGVETFRDLTAITSLRQQLTKKFRFEHIISKSDTMQRLFKIMPEIARSPSTVLVMGESGTGKELVARALYNASSRRDKPFIAVNCGALPETLLESELFGYKAGAFTDAKKDKDGRFAAAEGGTLFLDEIGDIPASIQVKLLRVLQEKVYEPLGSNTPVKADVRIITATNRNLREMVKNGEFREDLFYRLNVVNIKLPALRERKEDIPLLVEHFIRQFSAQQGKDIVGISPAALNILMHYDFPGNIRELENIIEYSFILCEGGYIQPEHLPETFSDRVEERGNPAESGKVMTLEDIEKEAIFLALERNRWRKMDTCRELGISKDTLRRKIAKYKLEPTE